MPHCDSDDRRARSDLGARARPTRAYAPDATGRGEWRFCCSSPADVCDGLSMTVAYTCEAEVALWPGRQDRSVQSTPEIVVVPVGVWPRRRQASPWTKRGR